MLIHVDTIQNRIRFLCAKRLRPHPTNARPSGCTSEPASLTLLWDPLGPSGTPHDPQGAVTEIGTDLNDLDLGTVARSFDVVRSGQHSVTSDRFPQRSARSSGPNVGLKLAPAAESIPGDPWAKTRRVSSHQLCHLGSSCSIATERVETRV